MNEYRIKAYAKINLGLDVVRRLENGYHEVKMVMKTVVIYAKMCRGEMVRYIIKERVDSPEGLRGFSWEGFAFDEKRSTDDHLLFTPG